MCTNGWFSTLVLGIALGALSACDGDGGGRKDGPVAQDFDGTWAVCRNEGGDYREVFTISGTAVQVRLLFHETTDSTCDGDATPFGEDMATATYSGTVGVPFGGGTVQATKVDLALGGETFYTLVYRDTSASPDALHLGDDGAVLDGSTPALRPDTLQDLARTLQVVPVAADLTGAWGDCPAGGPGDGGRILRFDAAAHTFVAEKYTGSCDGTPFESRTGTFTLSEPVMVSLGGRTVTAFAVDITFSDQLRVFTTFWVDREASPPRLHRGDDGLHGMNGTSASLRARVLWERPFLKRP